MDVTQLSINQVIYYFNQQSGSGIDANCYNTYFTT